MIELQITEAYDFYQRFILDYSRDKSQIYEQYGFTLQGSVVPKDWEVFVAILLNDRAKPGHGADLMNYEVKSAMAGASFEYQYHRNHGIEKLNDDMNIDHVFIVRNRSYSDINVWLVEREIVRPIFERWLPELRENYADNQRQRFRRSISFGFVIANGRKLLEIERGTLIHSQ